MEMIIQNETGNFTLHVRISDSKEYDFLIDKVEDYGHAPEGDMTKEGMQKRLQEVMQHMKDTKSFREQLELMQKGQKPEPGKKPEEPEKHTLQGFLQGFKKGE